MIEIDVPENCLVAFNQMMDGVSSVARITISEGVLVQTSHDGAVQIVAPGHWENLQIWPDPDYVAPERPLEPPAGAAYAVADEPLKHDPTVEPDEGWLDDEQAEAYRGIMEDHDGDVAATWHRMVSAELPVPTIPSDPNLTLEENYWASLAKLARRLRPLAPVEIDVSTHEGPITLVLRPEDPADEFKTEHLDGETAVRIAPEDD